MKIAVTLIFCALLEACSTGFTPSGPINDLFHDELFKPASVRINPEDALAMTEPMAEYARLKLGHQLGHVNIKDRRLALVDVMYTKGELRLEYDATQTNTAAEAFAAKKGNCLSLVLLTAAMARQIGLPMHFQSVVGVTDWSKSDNFFMSIGHVNLVLDELPSEFEMKTWSALPVVIDFLPPDKAAVLNTRPIDESTVLAMFLNNRAVETLIQGNADNAYWWAKAALIEDPGFINSYITLGVIFRSAHHSEFAETVLNRIALSDPDNTTMLSNRILVLRDLGREPEARILEVRLAELDRHPPWGYFFQAQAEYTAGHYENARHLYEREIARDPDHHEFEFGLALTYDKLHDPQHAIKHLERALELSSARSNHDFYAAKLAKLKATGSL